MPRKLLFAFGYTLARRLCQQQCFSLTKNFLFCAPYETKHCITRYNGLEERGIEFVPLREWMGIMTPGKIRLGVGLVSGPRRPRTLRGPPSTSVPLEQHHHDDAGKQ